MTIDEIRTVFFDFIKTQNATMIANVVSVDKKNRTCSVEDNGVVYYNVRLQAITGSNAGIVMFPKKEAFALLAKVEDSEEWVVLTATEYDSIEIKIDSLVINEGNNGGLTNTPELVSQLKKNNEILSAILQVVTSAPIPEPGNNSPSAFQNALGIALSGKEVGDFSRIENEKIKH